jgi:hypothetical protein
MRCSTRAQPCAAVTTLHSTFGHSSAGPKSVGEAFGMLSIQAPLRRSPLVPYGQANGARPSA